MPKHSCDRTMPDRVKYDGKAQDGDKWKCKCGQVWVHACDEADGCCWLREMIVTKQGPMTYQSSCFLHGDFAGNGDCPTCTAERAAGHGAKGTPCGVFDSRDSRLFCTKESDHGGAHDMQPDRHAGTAGPGEGR